MCGSRLARALSTVRTTGAESLPSIPQTLCLAWVPERESEKALTSYGSLKVNNPLQRDTQSTTGYLYVSFQGFEDQRRADQRHLA
jgi:hypothetical protein